MTASQKSTPTVERVPSASVVGVLEELRLVSLLRCDLMARLEQVHAKRCAR